ncbi:prephenate dehydrogenase [Ammoniphilus sp. CFH 90114]|uniref:prephenate dehydrogenase n=1 Tax=Ammoniphilus sp. CFH 90114 TaxID=2493665 RepID=UPI00100F7A70|nr:prephenate dehydrogenase [Ammoniphilus sp. CFH 90114]RXT13919.1 prephenate dehydrogenase [Ammoniphilus sp. CFH 90114]
MKKIAVLGVGLIGGSLALSLKNKNIEIIGFDVDEENLQKALELGVIHKGTQYLAEAVQEADVIFLCSPVGKLFELISFLRYTPLKEGAIITDTGSTKSSIVEWTRDFQQRKVHFIGGHPMAGSHKSGVEAAHDRLFENAYYVLTPDASVPEEAVSALKELLAATKANIVVLDPEEHDKIVGAISHFPHIIAAALVNQVERYSEDTPWYNRLAAGGFRDITRIASSNPHMWRDILLHNRKVMLSLAEDWKTVLDEIIGYVKESDGQAIEGFFRDARDFRNQMPERKKGAIAPLYDLYVDVPDHPGVIGKITTLLGLKQISITNIRILEIREDIMGVLLITFRDEDDLEKAREVLMQEGYRVYSRE